MPDRNDGNWGHCASVAGRAGARRATNAAAALLAIVVLLAVGGARASDDEVAPFVGAFQGESVADPTRTLTPGDIDVEIRPAGHGFVMDWRSVVIENGAVERYEHEVVFEPDRARHVYFAHGRRDLSGNLRAPEPIRGEPYIWARVAAGALTVYVMQIVTDGSVDLRIYRRTVDGDRMLLQFTRLRDGRPLLVVDGVLRRKAP